MQKGKLHKCCMKSEYFFYRGGEITYFCMFLNFLLGSGTVPRVLLLKQNRLFLEGNFFVCGFSQVLLQRALKEHKYFSKLTIHLISAEQQTRIKTYFCEIDVFVLDGFFNVLWKWTGVGKLMP